MLIAYILFVVLGLVPLTVFIYYFSRGEDWMLTDYQLREKYEWADEEL